MGLADVRVQLSAGGSTVTVNGALVPCRRVVVEYTGSVPSVYLEIDADVQVEGEGVVNALRPLQGNPVLEFLEDLDPEALEQAALENVGALGGETVSTSFLSVLKKLAVEEAPE